MDGYEWQSLRNEFAPSTALAIAQGNLLGVDSKFKHYLDCYRQHFHPFFPIVQHSTLISTPPPPLLALLMVVIGAQFSNFPESKNYSTFLYELCVGFLQTVGKIHTIIYCYRFAYAINSKFQQPHILVYQICKRSFCSRLSRGFAHVRRSLRTWPCLPGFGLFIQVYVLH